ncbi:MAG: Activator of (R)-2-hydroxyglutaryl-CoA dehydratase [Candidatus Ozemobacter sibiricus]|uniref:Activator of (R)-2-hydroxyglutaryl-CoA dehydratase n=1 Tax=Candidatus Ozemobacter sibiricus TaxID=2268124 RepID=A0A367ZRB6_9BACT|nr:MAG: Activator of (R)-2-hydroxyglutaryl-CoA dehydratase [Candidatus Ozemobacter sibiricus]
MAHPRLTIGFDIGSVSINTAICSPTGEFLEELPYRRHFGQTVELCARLLREIETRYGADAIERVVFTGTHGKAMAEATGTFFEIETTAQTRGLYRLFPEARTVISIGGHDSTLLVVEPSRDGFLLEDFKLNEACAAGTGSFIDQQAERVYADLPQFAQLADPQARIEAILARFIEEGLKSDQPANVACRCTVFTKSDMIHLQNKGIAIRHIIAGLHEGVAKNFKSTLITNRHLQPPIAFIGGYATNVLARKAFETILEMPIVVPPHHTSIGAFGACLAAQAAQQGRAVRAAEIEALRGSAAFAAVTTPPLCLQKAPFTPCGEALGLPPGTDPVEVYMGFDIGSTTTKLVLIDPTGRVLYKRYIPTEGQPVVAIKKALRHAMATVDTGRLRVLAIGTTGSGREVANLFVGADDVVNEVTAHARGTTFFRPDVDTIFELGGQDAKYTALADGFVVDFRMNKVCAAGTGSFLEETAHKLGIDIANEYETLALAAKAPYKLTERCTVYMESDLMSYLQMGGAREDLLAGLAQAVVHNYLNRVVQDGRIGEVISFQGGPSLNKSVVAAFEMVTGRPIITLPHREVMGAIGAALHARDEREAARRAGKAFASRFRDWNVVEAPFSHIEEICQRNPTCHNQCKLQVYRIGQDEAIYGGECGLYESRAQAAVRAPDFNKIRQNLYFKAMAGKYRVLGQDASATASASDPATAGPAAPGAGAARRPVIGIPRSLSFFQLGLAWVHLWHDLGYDVVITPETDHRIVDDGIEAMTCEACFPVKISHGHTRQLIGQCDYLFLPMMIEMHAAAGKKGYYCPYLEANTYMVKAALRLDDRQIIMPAIYLKEGPERLRESFREEFVRLGLPFEAARFDAAWQKAEAALTAFDRELKRIGAAFLEKLGDQRAIVVVGRPYSAYDSRTNLNLFATFSRLGIMAIPQEFLDIDQYRIEDDYPNMYWGFGGKILRAARLINHDPRLFGLYLTSFSCGPDSFILHFFNHEMARTGRPYLELELDEHSAGAGVETRLLAFLDVIKNQRQVKVLGKDVHIQPRKATAPLRGRTIYLPKMSEGSAALAAAFEGVGCKARVMETYTKAGIEFGKRHTSGKECYPCTVTTGDMFNLLNQLHADKVDVENEIAFFMPETEGPCRFGQYNRLHRLLLDRYGLGAVPIISPSSEDAYRCNGFFDDEQADTFRKLGWEAIVYADLMEKALWRVRPYETTPGTTDRVFAQAMQDGIEAIRRGGGLRLLKAARRAAAAFAAIERRREARPLIGIVGEIYVRTHKESNQHLVRTLEQMGCETYTSSIAEWIDYTTHTSISEAVAAARQHPGLRTYGQVAREWLTGRYQRAVAGILGFPFRDLLRGRFDHETAHLLHEVEGLFSNHINGEAILSIGGALSFARDGFNGVVNAMPFTCMPSTIASSILKVALRQKIPYVDMIYDGTILPNRETNLATFVFQARQNREAAARQGW